MHAHSKQLQSYANDAEHVGCRTLHSGTFPAYMKMRNGFYLFMKTLLRTCELSVNFFARPVCPSHSNFIEFPPHCLTSFLFVLSDAAETTTTKAAVAATKRASLVMLPPQLFSLKFLRVDLLVCCCCVVLMALVCLGPSIPGCSDSEGGASTAGGP